MTEVNTIKKTKINKIITHNRVIEPNEIVFGKHEFEILSRLMNWSSDRNDTTHIKSIIVNVNVLYEDTK